MVVTEAAAERLRALERQEQQAKLVEYQLLIAPQQR